MHDNHFELSNNQLWQLISGRISHLERLVIQMAKATQAQLDADTTQITDAVSQLGGAVTAIQTELDNLKQANPDLDASALDAAVAQLNSSVSSVQSLAPAAPAAGTVSDPAPADGSGDAPVAAPSA